METSLRNCALISTTLSHLVPQVVSVLDGIYYNNGNISTQDWNTDGLLADDPCGMVHNNVIVKSSRW